MQTGTKVRAERGRGLRGNRDPSRSSGASSVPLRCRSSSGLGALSFFVLRFRSSSFRMRITPKEVFQNSWGSVAWRAKPYTPRGHVSGLARAAARLRVSLTYCQTKRACMFCTLQWLYCSLEICYVKRHQNCFYQLTILYLKFAYLMEWRSERPGKSMHGVRKCAKVLVVCEEETHFLRPR